MEFSRLEYQLSYLTERFADKEEAQYWQFVIWMRQARVRANAGYRPGARALILAPAQTQAHRPKHTDQAHRPKRRAKALSDPRTDPSLV